MDRFHDREDAGRRLASRLKPLAAEHPIVLGLPGGGVPVGYEIARALGAPLDVWVVKKVGVPWHLELGLGAVAEGGYVQINQEILDHINLDKDQLDEAITHKLREVDERVRRLCGDRPRPILRDRTVIVVDDGIATGGTIRVAIRSIRAQRPRSLVLAVPVAPPELVQALAAEADRVVCLRAPEDLYAIGLWYENFVHVEDAEVVRLLERARRGQAGSEPAPVSP